MKINNTINEISLGGRFTFPGTSLTVQRMGYGAMQLADPGVYGQPEDPEVAIALLREAVTAGDRNHHHVRNVQVRNEGRIK
jgi:hypothetical protein